ncbi:MAG TPA: fatty acid desaturase [Candidatus Sulfotelmatobacter sp.]|nr:fatty acid desaturase [Candidatus Sulfotelmatobacter sp.]
MNAKQYPIPARLNILLAICVVCGCLVLLWASGRVYHWWAIALLALAYGFAMNTGYALCHEAEHDMFHPNKIVNDIWGTIVTLFFPASFQLRRQGHIGHHLRNRTDDEAFDLYFENENPVWKWIQFYGILTGFFWLMIVISNFIAVVNPRWLARKTGLDRPTAALQESLNPRYFRLTQLEAFLVFLVHGSMIYFFKIPILHYFAVLCGFGFIWSTLQYIHHYGTPRDVQKGAWNVRTWRIFDLIWLNHHWHLNHHLSPNVPWIYLPGLRNESVAPIPFWKAYFRQWRGPRLTLERVINRHAGKVIK